MAFRKFATKSDYDSATFSTTESTVSLIEAGNEIKINGVNVRTTEPVLGDAVYVDSTNNKVIYIKADTLKTSAIPSGWSFFGFVIENTNDGILVGYYNMPSKKFLGVCEYDLIDVNVGSDVQTRSVTFTLRFGAPDWDHNTEVTASWQNGYHNARTAIENAIKAACPSDQVNEWTVESYGLKSDNNVCSFRIYRLNCTDYRFYICSGCTHNSWLDMPESNNYMKVNGQLTNYRGLQNIARGAAYWATNGRTPDATINVGSETGNTNPVTESAFNSSSYCSKLRNYYGTYEKYLAGEFGINAKQKYGCFGLPSGQELTKKYGGLKVSGVPRYPTLNYAYELDLGVDGLRAGDLFQAGVREGTMVMEDNNLAKINACLTKAGQSTISNSNHIWWAQRYGVNPAWVFDGYYGYLYYSGVSSSFRCLVVALLKH